MGWGGRLLGGGQAAFYFAGIVISWVSFAGAMTLLHAVASLDRGPERAWRAALYAAIFPAAYFYGLVYSESLFLLTLLGAVLAIRSRQWAWAAVAGAAMTATRVNGVMFVPALVWSAWQTARDRQDRLRGLAAVAVSLAGIGGYALYNFALSGDPLAWYHSIQRWGYQPGGNPFTRLLTVADSIVTHPYTYLTTNDMAPYDTLNALSAAMALAAVPFIWRRFGGPYAAVVLLGLVLPLSSGELEGLARHTAVLFPLPLLLASINGPATHLVLVAASAMIYTLGLTLFPNVHPVF